MEGRDNPDYRWLHAVNLLLLLGLWVFTIIAYPRLPEQIPAHIGTSGVTRWTDRNSGFWFLLPILAVFEAAFMYVLSRLADSGASGVNVPHKKRMLALPREAQVFAMEPTRAFMYGMATWLLLLTGMIQVVLYQAAHTGGDTPDTWFMLAFTAFSLLPLAGVPWLNRAIGRRLDEWESRVPSQGQEA